MTRRPDSAQAEVLQVQEDRMVVGEWSGDLMELAARSADLRGMLRSGRRHEARALVQTRSAAEQAALVALDENPEEVLALTGMDENGKPGYKSAVVEVLPTEVLTDLIVPRSARHGRFNAEVIQAMSPGAFARTVEDTLDPVYHQELRTRVSWEWLEAVAALQDHHKAAELLRQVDPEAAGRSAGGCPRGRDLRPAAAPPGPGPGPGPGRAGAGRGRRGWLAGLLCGRGDAAGGEAEGSGIAG